MLTDFNESSNWSCGWTKVWCHNQTIKAGNAAKTAQKLNASTWSDKTNSLKQIDFPSLLSEVGTNTIWASKIKHCCTLSSEQLDFVKSLLFQFCLVRSNENHVGSLLIEKRSHWFNCRVLATACLFWNETSNCIALPPAPGLWDWQAAKSFGRGFGRLPTVSAGCQLALEAGKTGFCDAPEEAKMAEEPSCEHLEVTPLHLQLWR